MDSDQIIVARCVRGDREAWDEFIRQKQNMVFLACRRFTASRDEARDATQEVFLKVVIGLRTYDPKRGTVSGWLRKVTRRVLVDRWRRRTRRPEVLAPLEGYLDSLPGPEERRLDHARLEERDAARIRNAVDKLPDSLREAVLLRYYSGLKYRQISEALKLPVGTVKVRLHRSHAKLATRLSPEFDPR